MSFDRYADWLGRGRAHQVEGRLIDALICYRRALRELPQGADAQFHIGEIAWRMGDASDAIATWRKTTEVAPSHVASWHALADACAVAGDVGASEAAVRRVLALSPGEARARVLLVLLAAVTGDVADAALADALRSSAQWPLALLARIVEHVFTGERRRALPTAAAVLLQAAAAAAVTSGNEDAMRRIALALARAGETDRAQTFADLYAEACRALHRPSMPLLWPRRTAGDALRVGVLVAPGSGDDGAAFRAALVAAGLGDRVACTVLTGPDATPLAGQRGDASRERMSIADDAARMIAALDLDVLIDLAGVHEASGPLLALRPARAIWAIERGDVPSLRTLADGVFTQAAWPTALRELHTPVTGTPAPAAEITAGELARRWEAAVLAHRQGDVAAARAGYRSVRDVQPDHAPALYLEGVTARTAGDMAAARECFRAALRAAPAYAEARVALVDASIAAGATDEAAQIARDGLALGPESVALWRALGMAELARGDGAAAASAFAEALKRAPADGETHYNHGVALQTMRNMADAARAYQRALTFRPDLHAADFNLGVVFDLQGNAAAAIAAFSNVLSRAPDHVAAYKALAETLLASGRIDAWFANFERFERHCPGHLALAVHALEVCAYRADFPRLAGYLDGLRNGRYTSERPDETLDALQQLLYLLHFFDVEPELIGKYARTHDALARTLYGEPLPRRTPRVPGKLRIGYLSGDFRNHVMGKMMWEVISRHDRARFDVFGYATGEAKDEWTARFGSAFTAFRELAALSDPAAAQAIAGDDLDVLIDLSTHTKGARPGVLARKPARVQITHVASAGTLALSAIDFKLTDRHADARDDPAQQIEPLLAMDGCVYPYRHIAPAAATAFTREALGIAPAAVVIGAFCAPMKLSQRCLALWREVLARVPNAVLAFSPLHPALADAFRGISGVAGIAPERIVFVPQGRDDAENQARYRMVDFVLDPLPYGGVNGTLEALDMGVPVVTLVGRRHAERTSFSILANLGVTETIAETGGDYVALAVRLAIDPAFMRTVRARIAEGLRRSPLTDMDAHVRHLETAYVRALEARAPEALAGTCGTP